jgi:phage-related protein
MTLKTLYKGQRYTLYALIVDERCFAFEFLSEIDKQSETQIVALFKHIGASGPPVNEEKFKHLEGKIYELKTRTGVRILSFFGKGQSLILTHGFSKPSQKKLKIEISKAAEWEKAYQQSLKIQSREKR